MDNVKYLIVLAALLSGFSTVEAQSIDWLSMKEAQEKALENGKKIFIYTEADWCGYCKKVEREVFSKPEVQDSLAKYYLPVKVDIESDEMLVFNGEQMTQLQFSRALRVTSTPTFFFVDKTGKILGRQPGFIPADIFQKLLSFVGSDAYLHQEFINYMK